MKLFGIAGTNGSGKDTVGQMLAERHNFLFVSITEILRDEAIKRGQPVERVVLAEISAEWRRTYGLGILIDKAIEIYNLSNKKTGLVVASLRNEGEVDRIHQMGGKVVWVDGNPKIRFSRISHRHRSSEDNKTFEQFIKEEQAEMNHPGDSATTNWATIKAISDVWLDNNGNDIEAFKDQAEKALDAYIEGV